MTKREKLIKVIRKSLVGMLPVYQINEIAPKVADGILNSGKYLSDIFKENEQDEFYDGGNA